MPRKEDNENEQPEEEEKVITIREDAIYGYEDTIDKICGRKEPRITQLLRIKAFEPGVYKIRNGLTKHIVPGERIEVLDVVKVLWIRLKNEQARQLLGAAGKPVFENYLIDLRKYFSKHEMAYMNRPFMYLHNIRHIPKPVQHSFEIEVV